MRLNFPFMTVNLRLVDAFIDCGTNLSSLPAPSCDTTQQHQHPAARDYAGAPCARTESGSCSVTVVVGFSWFTLR